MDQQTYEDIEAYGKERWLEELTQELKSRTYQPQPVRRVYIPKSSNGDSTTYQLNFELETPRRRVFQQPRLFSSVVQFKQNARQQL